MVRTQTLTESKPYQGPQKYASQPEQPEPTVKPSGLTDLDLIVLKATRAVFFVNSLGQDQLMGLARFITSIGGGFAAFNGSKRERLEKASMHSLRYARSA